MSSAPFDQAAPSRAFEGGAPASAGGGAPGVVAGDHAAGYDRGAPLPPPARGRATTRGHRPFTVAILCPSGRGTRVATALTLAAARACEAPCGIAAALGQGAVPARSLSPAARRAANALREHGQAAVAVGGAVWLADGPVSAAGSRAPRATAHEVGSQIAAGAAQEVGSPVAARAARDAGWEVSAGAARDADWQVAAGAARDAGWEVAAGAAREAGSRVAAGRGADPQDPASAAALSTRALRAARVLGVPAVVALPGPRSAALDRVLAWHDAIVVVRDPRASATVAALVLDSLRVLGRPVVAIDLPTRLGALGAAGGLHAPAYATRAVAELRLAGAGR